MTSDDRQTRLAQVPGSPFVPRLELGEKCSTRHHERCFEKPAEMTEWRGVVSSSSVCVRDSKRWKAAERARLLGGEGRVHGRIVRRTCGCGQNDGHAARMGLTI